MATDTEQTISGLSCLEIIEKSRKGTAMKPKPLYQLYAWGDYPGGGPNDLLGTYDSWMDAGKALKKQDPEGDYTNALIVKLDPETGAMTILQRYGYPEAGMWTPVLGPKPFGALGSRGRKVQDA